MCFSLLIYQIVIIKPDFNKIRLYHSLVSFCLIKSLMSLRFFFVRNRNIMEILQNDVEVPNHVKHLRSDVRGW